MYLQSFYKISLLVFTLFVSQNLHSKGLFSDMEYSLHGGLRYYPWGGKVSAKAKKEHLFWGDKGNESKKNFMYGHITPEGTLYTAGTVNGLRFDVNVFPISFLGFRFGYETYYNNKEYSAYDCETYECVGGVEKSYIELLGGMKYQKLFLKLRLIRQKITQRDQFGTHFIEPSTGLVAKNDGDHFLIDQYTFGYLLTEKWVLSVLYIYSQAQNLENSSDQMTFNVTYLKDKHWTLNGGLGNYKSTTKEQKFTFLLLGEYRF